MIRFSRGFSNSARAAFWIFALLLTPGTSLADGVADEAELQFQIGREAYIKSDFRTAFEHFLQSNRLVPNRNVVYNIAQCLDKLQRYADAYRYYVDALEGETNAAQIADIEEKLRRLTPDVAVLRVESDPPGATIFLERKDLGSRGRAPRPLAVPAGRYTVIVELPEHETLTLEGVDAVIGSETRVRAKLKPILGQVVISMEGAPSAAIFLDNPTTSALCIAPCSFSATPGQHQIFARRDGFESWSQSILIKARETTNINVPMKPLAGTLMVQADERDAIVEIDGKPAGFTPAIISNVAVGKRLMTVKLRGYEPVQRVVEIKSNQETQVYDLKLIPSRKVAAVSRYTEDIDEAPSSVTIIDKQEIRAFGYPTLWEALRGIRGISLSNDRVYQSAAIRGFGDPNDFGNRMVVLQDGAVLNDNLVNSTYIGTDGRSDLLDIDTIEIVRGPGSLLYGGNAMSGVINIVPHARDEKNSVHASIGTYDNAVFRARAGFHYNINPKVGAWASISGTRSAGVSIQLTPKDKTLGSSITVNGIDTQNAYGTAGGLWAGPVTMQWYYNQREQRLPMGAWGSQINDLSTYVLDRRFLGEVRYEPKLSKTLNLALRAHVNHYSYEGSYLYTNPPSQPKDQFAGTWIGGEARLIYTPVKRLRLTLGGEVQAHFTASLHGRDISQPAPNGVYLDNKTPYNLFSPYVLGEVNALSWLRFSGGFRLNLYDGFVAESAKGPPVFRAAAVMKPTPSTIIKLMGGNSFRAPSVYEQYYQDGGYATYVATVPGKFALQPEEIFSGEIEISQHLPKNFSLLGSVWANQVDNIITTITVDGANGQNTGNPDPAASTQRYTNSPDPVVLAGLDFEVRREWRQGWMVTAFYSHQRARYSTDNPEVAKNPSLVNSPRHLAAVRAVVPLVPDFVSLATRLVLESPRRINIISDEMTDTSFTADVTLSGKFRRFGVSYVLGLYNLANQQYDYATRPSFLGQTSRQNGRTFLLNLTTELP